MLMKHVIALVSPGTNNVRQAAAINRWRRLLPGIVTACLMAGQPVIAQELITQSPALDFSEAAREAVSWHPSIVEAAGRLNAQEQRITEVRAGLYPQISGGIGSGYDSTLRGGFRPSANISIDQRLFDFGKLDSELDGERAGTRAAQAQVLLSVDAIIRDTSFSMIEILRGQALLDAAQEQLGRVRSISDLVDARYRRGAITRSDAFQTQSRVDAAQSTIQQIEAEFLRWQSNLAYLLGRDEAPPIEGGLPDALGAACTVLEVQWSDAPALREAQARLEQAEAQARRQRADRMPTISLGAGASRDLHDPLGDDRGRYDVGLRVNSSIFNGGASSARVRGAEYAQQAALAAVENARLNSERSLAEARSQVGMLGERTDTLRRRFATMEQTRELYRLQYLELGTRTLVDLLNADQELSQIRFEEVNARFDLARLGVDCLYATGRLRSQLGLGGMTVEGVPL